MKKLLSFTAIAVCMLSIFSCKKDEGKLPNISFITGGGYTSSDATVAQGAAITFGINASKAEDKDVLTSFDVSVSYDGAAATSVVNVPLTGAQGDSYTIDIPIITRSVAGTEKYIFTVVNRDGLRNSVDATLTVN